MSERGTPTFAERGGRHKEAAIQVRDMSNVEPDPEQKELSRIPLSSRVLWQTVRMRVVPPVVLLAVAAGIFWQWKQMNPGGVPGIAEGPRSTVTSPLHAYIAEIKVQPYQHVEAGDPIVVLRPADPRTKLDLLQLELQIARLEQEPSLAEQNALDFERLRVEESRLQQELAVAEVELRRAESALARNKLLLKEKLVSDDGYELSLRDRDTAAAEIKEKTKSLAQIQGRMVALGRFGEPDLAGTNNSHVAFAAALHEKLQAATHDLQSVVLTAPISGMVHSIDRQQGDFIAEGDLLFVVYGTRSDRVLTYLRQPYPLDPQVGMKVEVVTRDYHRQRFLAEVSQVGAQLETITNSLAFLRPGALVDVGLPVIVALPAEAKVRPGETVDVGFLQENAAKAPAHATALKVRSDL